MNSINIAEIIKKLKTEKFYLDSGIPLEYSYGYPMFDKRGKKLCMHIPFLRYKVTGEVDKTLVFPIKYVITVSLPEGKIVGFQDLACNNSFNKVDFVKPIGYFRHEAVKNLNKAEYKKKRAELFAYYNKVLNSLADNQQPSKEDADAMKKLLGIMLEPCLRPIYKALSKDFYNKYL